MATGCTKTPENIYFRCRKEAGKHNPAVTSRENTAELLGISVSTLANYELGITKSIPVDIVARMADLYNAPELKHIYCVSECPIGRDQPIATEITSIEKVALKLLKTIDGEGLDSFRKSLIDVALQAPSSDGERQIYKALIARIDELMVILSELRMLGEKWLKE